MDRQLVHRPRSDDSGGVDQYEKELSVTASPDKPNEVSCREFWQQTVTIPQPEAEGSRISIRSTTSELRARLEGVVMHIDVAHRFHQSNNVKHHTDDSHVDSHYAISAQINLRVHFDAGALYVGPVVDPGHNASYQQPMAQMPEQPMIKMKSGPAIPTMPKAMKQQHQQVVSAQHPSHHQQHHPATHDQRYANPFVELSQTPAPTREPAGRHDSRRHHSTHGRAGTMGLASAIPGPGPTTQLQSKSAGKRRVRDL